MGIFAKLKSYLHRQVQKQKVKNSGLFDSTYYLKTNPDIKSSGIPAIIHYLFFGAFEGRNPSPYFNSSFYLEKNPDVYESGLNPLLHYIDFGYLEGRLPSELNITNQKYYDYRNRIINKPGKNRFRLQGTFWNLINPLNYFPVFSAQKFKVLIDPNLQLDTENSLFNSDFYRYQRFLKNQTTPQYVLNQQKNWCKNFKNPDNISVLITGFKDSELLKNTLNSIVAQSYIHWTCYILSPKIDPHSKKLLQLTKAFPNQKVKVISDIEILFSEINKHQGYISFLAEGETLMRECFWQFLDSRDPLSELIYSDHDYNANNEHCEPWFTVSWAPDLLLSQNYIGGFYLVSNALFTQTFRKHNTNIDITEKIKSSAAWRYGLLLILGTKTNHIFRVPKILWSAPQLPEKDLHIQYHAEYNEVKSFINCQSLKAEVEISHNAKIRHVKWELKGKPLVSIIIPTTGKIKYLKKCLDSIRNVTAYQNYEIIVIDNGRGQFPDGITYANEQNVKIISILEPFNWARLNNIGAKSSKGELLLLLNDDIEIVNSEWLGELVRQAIRPDIAVVGSLLLYPNGSIQHAGVFLVDHGGGARHLFCLQKPGENIYQQLDECVRETSANTGAAMMVSKRIFFEIGLFDENLSLVGNDIDFCLKCTNAGYRNLWTPHSKIIHYESASRKAMPTQKDEAAMWERWRELFLSGDPYYNPNLSLVKEDYSLWVAARLGQNAHKPEIIKHHNLTGLNM